MLHPTTSHPNSSLFITRNEVIQGITFEHALIDVFLLTISNRNLLSGPSCKSNKAVHHRLERSTAPREAFKPTMLGSTISCAICLKKISANVQWLSLLDEMIDPVRAANSLWAVAAVR
eukprot:gnl/MRDRNA2_/MRDRNA2_260367_c0_seq1.p1 gnl/MRDRNA2_/MRDRNA2_260367_c0~~gnl/MRDRNA2_/MRDRNA2_260367_c0_seq1.p1  ORF type:complete len:118 (+),score=3.91 gnl/MRDRNA2_/MRDRNA2_260367_c0_seq1:170-523(+)